MRVVIAYDIPWSVGAAKLNQWPELSRKIRPHANIVGNAQKGDIG